VPRNDNNSQALRKRGDDYKVGSGAERYQTRNTLDPFRFSRLTLRFICNSFRPFLIKLVVSLHTFSDYKPWSRLFGFRKSVTLRKALEYNAMHADVTHIAAWRRAARQRTCFRIGSSKWSVYGWTEPRVFVVHLTSPGRETTVRQFDQPADRLSVSQALLHNSESIGRHGMPPDCYGFAGRVTMTDLLDVFI